MTRSLEVWDTLCRVIFNFVTRMRCDLYLLKRERERGRERHVVLAEENYYFCRSVIIRNADSFFFFLLNLI